MNILKRIGSIALAAILLMGAASFSANAQFKGLGNKLKGKVEKTIKKKVDKKKREAQGAVEKAAGVDSESNSGIVSGSSKSETGGFDYKRPTLPAMRQKLLIRSPLQLKCGKGSTKVSDNFTEPMRIWRISP